MCVSPTFVWVERGVAAYRQPVPCRRCWRCRSNRVSDYIGRALCEASVSDWTRVVTLTYADTKDGSHEIIRPQHFQNFIKLLRKIVSLRYMVAGEYGAMRGRAHFHAVLFGKGHCLQWPLRQIFWRSNIWPHGHMFVDDGATHRQLKYVCKYVLKDTDEAWFSLSKKPPIGAEWFREKAKVCVATETWPSSFEYLPPGGDAGRPYLMSGATRRDFLAYLLDAAYEQGPVALDRLSAWVGAVLDRDELRREQEAVARLPLDVQRSELAKLLERRRPDKRKIQAALMRTLEIGESLPSGYVNKDSLSWLEEAQDEGEVDKCDPPERRVQGRPSQPPGRDVRRVSHWSGPEKPR